jgi:hypothetical protein
LLAQVSHHSDTDAVNPLGRKVIATVAGVVVIEGVAWFGLQRHWDRIASEQRRAAFAACKERASGFPWNKQR